MQSGGLRTKNIFKQSRDNKPLITVITVVYNGKDTLEDTILSVIHQTYENTEYIIVDGSSSDGTLDIIKKYEDKIDYWISEPDEGLYYAMNKGIDLARGKWLNFMNSGDLFYNNTVINEIFGSPRAYKNIIYGNTIYKIEKDAELVYPKISDIVKKMPFCHQSSFTEYELMKKYKYDTSYKLAADYNFLYSLYVKGIVFEYVNITVSVFEAEGGVSARRRTMYNKERIRARGEKIYSFHNILVSLNLYVRYILKKLLPHNAGYWIRRRKLKRRSLKSQASR
ncbi:glycosyl transferase [Spirochaetia bacterium]|nr:glycosyl transferase [Spirochaetia bacterium]